jgi:membrane associated rhomboid family serine protease
MTPVADKPGATATQPENPRAWDVCDWVPDQRSIFDYGYVRRGKSVGCTREELLRAAAWRGASQIKLAWTPETDQPLFPENIPMLTDVFRRTSIKEAWQAIAMGSFLVSLAVVLAIVFADWRYVSRNLWWLFGALAVTEGLWQLWRTRHYDHEDAAADASSARFDEWIKKKPISGYSFTLGAWILIVGAAQVLAGLDQSIQLAGLVKPAVWHGEWWRLFTACLMHGSFMHFWMNFLALLHFSRIVENTIHRAYVPFIFLVSGACGSIFSVLLYPHATSIGASGGLMGLFGFITAVAYFDRDRFPPKYLRRSLEGIAFVGIFGLLGFAFIDNAAHLGGLCGGLALGWLLRPSEGDVFVKTLIGKMSIVGIATLSLLGIVAAVAVTKIIAYW